MVIKFSRSSDKYGCFSNFTHCKVNFGGVTYNSTEAAWQAQKTLNENERKQYMVVKEYLGLNCSFEVEYLVFALVVVDLFVQ